MAIERDAVIRVRVQGAQQAESQLDGVAGGLNEVDASADRVAASARKTGVSFAQAGEAMERSLKPIDSTFKGFDRINGILGQLTNAARLLSGVALVELGGQLLQVTDKIKEATGALKEMRQATALAVRSAEAWANALVRIQDAAAGAFGGLVGFAELPAEQQARLLELQAQTEVQKVSLRLAIDEAAAATRALAQAEGDIINLRVRGEQDYLGLRQQALQTAQAEAAAARDRLKSASGALAATQKAIEAMRPAEGRGPMIAPGSSNPSPEVDGGMFAGGAFGMLFSLFGPTGALGPVNLAQVSPGIDTASEAMDRLSASTARAVEPFERMLAVSQNIIAASGTLGNALGALSSGFAAAGIQSEALVRAMNAVQAVTMGAKAAEAFADALKYFAGTPGTALPNPVLGAASLAAATAYTAAAAAYGAAAIGGSQTAGVPGGSGGVGSMPTPGAFGSARAQGGGGGGEYTINVNAPGAAFLSRRELQDIGTRAGLALATASNARGSATQANLRRAVGMRS